MVYVSFLFELYMVGCIITLCWFILLTSIYDLQNVLYELIKFPFVNVSFYNYTIALDLMISTRKTKGKHTLYFKKAFIKCCLTLSFESKRRSDGRSHPAKYLDEHERHNIIYSNILKYLQNTKGVTLES